MRLLLINYEYPPVGGGAANATWEMARAATLLGHEPFVLTAAYRARDASVTIPGVTLLTAPAIRRRKDRSNPFEMATFAASASLRIRKIIRKHGIELMIAFFSIPCGPIAWWGWRGTGVPYMVSLRGGDVPGNEPGLAGIHALLRPVRKAIFAHAAAVVANSEGLALAAKRADNIEPLVIPNGIDDTFWCPGQPTVRAPVFQMLFVGRLHRQKRIDWLLLRLKEESTLPEGWRLHLVGDGPERAALADYAERLGLTKRLIWHGWRSREQLRELYRTLHLLVHPSAYEGMPNTCLEARSCGLPVLMSQEAVNGAAVFNQRGFIHFSTVAGFSQGLKLAMAPQMEPLDPANIPSWAASVERYLHSRAKPIPS